MAAETEIAWCDSTFNPWEGCARVSEGCQHCYAETRDKRMHGGDNWGKHAPRKTMSDGYWRQPLRWNRQAEAAGVRRRVFCASLADVFERHADTETNDLLNVQRARLWALIEQTPWLDWLLLTKRPENITGMVFGRWMQEPGSYDGVEMCPKCGDDADHASAPGPGEPVDEYDCHDPECGNQFRVGVRGWPDNVWIGTTIESPAVFDRLDHLRAIPARIRFISAEPLLADISDINLTGISWVICGGESGPGARPMHPEWARNLWDKAHSYRCARCGGSWSLPLGMTCENHSPVRPAFLFKQHGNWSAEEGAAAAPDAMVLLDGRVINRGEPVWIPDALGAVPMANVGKKVAGRLLDGRTWDEVPS